MMNEEDKKIASELMKEYYDKGFKDGLKMAIASLQVIYNSMDKTNKEDNKEEISDDRDTGHGDAKELQEV